MSPTWAQTLAWRKKNPEAWAAIQLRWAKKHREELRIYAAEYRLTHPDTRTASERRYKKHAQHKIEKAIERGDLVRPDRCERCGKFARPDAHHHKGYDHPLDVQWLCRSCHRKVHWKHDA